MSESHEKYKEYKKAQESRIRAQKRGSNYVDDYKNKERIKELEYKLADKEEKEDFDRGYDLLSKYEY